jgi:Transposase, Mutator family
VPVLSNGLADRGAYTTGSSRIFDVPDTIEPGCDAVTFVQQRIDVFAHRWRDSYPAAVRCLLDDRDSLTVYPRFPREHWPRTRHSNFIERTFGETRRRVKVIGRLPGEHCRLALNLGRARPRLDRLARTHHDIDRATAAARAPPIAARPATPTPTTNHHQDRRQPESVGAVT